MTNINEIDIVVKADNKNKDKQSNKYDVFIECVSSAIDTVVKVENKG